MVWRFVVDAIDVKARIGGQKGIEARVGLRQTDDELVNPQTEQRLLVIRAHRQGYRCRDINRPSSRSTSTRQCWVAATSTLVPDVANGLVRDFELDG